MKDIAVSQVSEFQTRFLQQMRAAHQQDVLDVLSSGVINDDVTAIITEVAQQVSMTLKK
jgi:F-type H+-transporting ATPase subunit alpha